MEYNYIMFNIKPNTGEVKDMTREEIVRREGAMIVEINKENWTGEKTKVRINPKKRTFTIDSMKEYSFKLSRNPQKANIEYIRSPQWGPNHILGTITFDGDRYYAYSDVGIDRDDVNPFIAAAKLLCNTI